MNEKEYNQLLRGEERVTYNRFEKISPCITDVQKEVYILERFLGVYPFPKYRHTVKYIQELCYLAENSQ